jgi:hypothetical protein
MMQTTHIPSELDCEALTNEVETVLDLSHTIDECKALEDKMTILLPSNYYEN